MRSLIFHSIDVAEDTIVVGTFDNTAGVIAVKAVEATFRKVDAECRVCIDRLVDAGDQLIVCIAHQHTGKAGRQRTIVIAALATEHDIRLGYPVFFGNVFECGLFGRALWEEIEEALAGLRVEAVDDDLVELTLGQFVCLLYTSDAADDLLQV